MGKLKTAFDRAIIDENNFIFLQLSPPPPPPPGMVPLADYLGNVVSRYIYIKEEHVRPSCTTCTHMYNLH